MKTPLDDALRSFADQDRVRLAGIKAMKHSGVRVTEMLREKSVWRY